MISNKKQYYFLLFSAVIGTVTSGLLWTGLPIYLSDQTSSTASLSTVYSWATFGSLLFSLVGGIIADHRDIRKICIATQFISAVLLIALMAVLQASISLALFVIPFLYFNLSLSMITEMVWVLKVKVENQNARTQLLDRAVVTTFAKLSSFAIGPIVFSVLGINAVLLCSLLFAGAGLTQFFIFRNSRLENSLPSENNNQFSWRSFVGLLSSPAFLATAFLSGILSVPLNPIFAGKVLSLGTISDVSAFWAVAGVGSLCGILLMRKFNFKLRLLHVAGLTLTMIIAVQGGLSSPLAIGTIVLSFVYTFCSSLFSTQFQVNVVSVGNESGLGSRLGVMNATMDFGIFFGMVLGTFAEKHPGLLAATAVSLLLVARAICYVKLHTEEHS